MENFYIDFAVSVAITLLRRLVADDSERAAYRKIFFKVFTLIWGVFGDDAAFRAVVGLPPDEPLPPIGGLGV